ncbi:hypothetical protein D9758_002040 [Tetrapyrgos nigripes]|uniref:Uncharacterized protein n=1 Tax=Tetrapyrgos nigripes TaxID=182062 RepID=A0A8H5GT50_9AGAR|nr:hypothetical protein D9758_002040 [Tetrapyrgos nigripes]
MQQRYHAERKHLIQSLDALLHQLFCLSYYLSPSMFALLLRLSAQVMCRSPREMFPTLPLGGFLLVLLCFNGLSLYRHATHGAMEGGAIILDFVGLVIASFLYLFYFNRVLAWVLGLIIRLLYWGDSDSSIYLEIGTSFSHLFALSDSTCVLNTKGSIQFSILSGRILLKDVHYHSSNQTIKVVKAQIAWRYWIRRPTTEEEIGLSLGEDEKPTTRTSSCRIHLSLNGFEWLLYNRTAAYDQIMSQLRTKSSQHSPNIDRHATAPKLADSSAPTAPSLITSSLRFHTPGFLQNVISWIRRQLPNLDPKDLLPLGIEVVKGAIICGNSSTPNLLVAEFQRSDGTFGVIKSRSKYDLYKQMLTLHFKHASVQYVHNDDYCEPMGATGQTMERHIHQDLKSSATFSYGHYSGFSKLWAQSRLSKLVTGYFSLRKTRNHVDRRRRRKKSTEEDTPIGADFSTIEYAIERRILDTPLLQLCYYADVVGVVPTPQHPHVKSQSQVFPDIGNGDVGPEWGMDLVIFGGTLKYGPWADRQRSELQRAFFPPTYHNSEETPRLHPGDKRVWTALRVFVELRNDTTLVIPFREASKDWLWDGLTPGVTRSRKREHAFLHLTAGDKSSISYLMPMLAGPKGYEPILEVHLDTIAVTSSLNDIRLVSAESCRIHCELPSPLVWDAEREWKVSVSLRSPTLFLLRDHINMFTDLGKDWAAGPPSDYHRFVPMVYQVGIDMHHYQIQLYANDHNIIDKPLIKEENGMFFPHHELNQADYHLTALFTLFGMRCQSIVKIPSNVFRPDSTSVTFSVEIPNVSINLSLPRWNTNALHAPKEGNNLANIGSFSIDGSYLYYSEVHQDNVEQLKLAFTARNIAFKALGWSIRYFMILKDNYFGSFTHFSTLYEYLDKIKKGEPPGDPIDLKYREGKSNMMQVEMSVLIKGGLLILPAGLSGYEFGPGSRQAVGIGHCVLLSVPELQLHFRMHDYFMEMSLNIDPVSASVEKDYPEVVVYSRRESRSCFVIDGIDITANRLFGAPPRTLTYTCIWEIHLGATKIDCSSADAVYLSAAGKAFLFNFDDFLNAPAKDYSPPVLLDLTFLKLSLDTVDAVWRAGKANVVLSIPSGMKLESNDLGGQFHKRLFSLALPQLNMKLLLLQGLDKLIEAADLEADLFLDIFSSPAGWHEKAEAQAEFVSSEDISTGRVKRMLANDYQQGNFAMHRNGVFIPGISFPDPDAYSNKGTSRARTLSDQSLQSMASQSSKSGDESVSEAVRDARLATTRAMTPKPLMAVEDADENILDGDESDDGDLTERSESEWMGSGDYSDAEQPESDWRLYRNLIRHYISRYMRDAIEWDGALIELVKGSKLPGVPPYTQHVDVELQSVKSFACPQKNADTTVYRIVQRKGTAVFVTPLLPQAFAFLEADMDTAIPSAELFLDSTLMSHLNSLLDEKKAKEDVSHSVLDIRLEAIRLRMLQHVGLATNVLQSPPLEVGQPDVSDKRCSVLDVYVQNISIYGQLSSRASVSAHLTFANARSELFIIENELHTVHVQPPSLILSVHKFSVTSNKATADVACSCFEVNISHSLPETLSLTSLAIADQASELAVTVKKLMKFRVETPLKFFGTILQSSDNAAVIDPLSTIQPSFLVQTGIPQELRANTAFRFLFHLRDCLWAIREADWDAGILDNHVDMDDLEPLLMSRLSVLDPDVYSTSKLDSLHPLFPNLMLVGHTPTDRSRSISMSVSATIQAIRIVISDSENHSSSEMSLGTVVASLRSQDLDLIELSSNTRSKVMSQVSLRKKPLRPIRRLSVSLYLGDIKVTLHPYLINFSQQIIRVRRQYGHALRSLSSRMERKITADGPSSDMDLDIVVSIHQMCLQAVADNLIFQLGALGLQLSSTILTHSRHPVVGRSMNNSLIFQDISVQARSPSTSSISGNEQLAILVLSHCGINSLIREDESDPTIRIVFRLGGLCLKVPRSAIRTYRFFKEWQADFLPGVEATMQALLSELEKTPNEPITSSPMMKGQPSLQVHGLIKMVDVHLRVMRHTWVSWGAHSTTAHFATAETPLKGVQQTFGIHLSSQVFSITSDSKHSDDNRVRIELPSIFLSGHRDATSIHALALMHFLELKAKPSHWDTLLVVQQKFGQDFNDLAAFIQETRIKQLSPKDKPSRPREQPARYSIFLKMDGFRIGFEGLSSVLYLECPGISGKLDSSPEFSWSVMVADLTLSLAPRRTSEGSLMFDRQHRSAFVIIDFKVASKHRGLGANVSDSLDISIPKVHAVMQPSSIGELGDFVDHLQLEILERRERNAKELAAFKEKTQRILQTFEVKASELKPTESSSWWLNKYSLHFLIRSVGVAFPLDHDRKIGSHDSSVMRAFLFSIRSVQFSIDRGETGQAKMEDFSFQFVSRFRQSAPQDFAGESHETRNRLIYPRMQARLRSSGTSSSRQFFMEAHVSGFILDLDSSIPDHVFSLADVYRRGKDRVTKLSASTTRNAQESPALKPANLPSSNFFASLTFLSGKVCMHNTASSLSSRSRSSGVLDHPSATSLEGGAEVFSLPVVSVWAEYRALPARTTRGEGFDGSILMFKTTIHSSHNTLRPTLLPFLTEIVDLVETRLRTATSYHEPARAVPAKEANAFAGSDSEVNSPVSSLQISFSLRIDQSRLELTCHPDVNVVAALNWDSGGFVITASPGARNVTFTGAVDDWMLVTLRSLLPSEKTEYNPNRTISSISFVLDTEFLGGVRFSRLQDILCFKAVWLDRIPLFNTAEKHPTPVPTIYSTQLAKQEFTTLALIRIRQIHLDIDLGQSISSVALHLKNSTLRSKFTESRNELSISVEHVSIAARGNVAGYADVSHCKFQTIRLIHNARSDNSTNTRMLELRMTSGPLVVMIESDYQKLLHYRAEPLEVEILDDWPNVSDDDRPLKLSFTVNSPEVVAVATVGTIPKLLSYANKFSANLEAQREGASRESQTFRVSQSPKPDNPLSAVAEAMINSARTRLEEAGSGLSYSIRQHMSLKLDLLRLVIFPRTMADVEVAQFLGRGVRGRLERLVESQAGAAGKRDIRLSFSFMKISRYTQLGHVAMPPSSELSDGKQWLEDLLKDAAGADIVGLPSMMMHMISEESRETQQKTLHYDFDSKFVRHIDKEQDEDIYITLNVGLYSWLTVLRKTLTRELEQAKTAVDWRSAAGGYAKPVEVPTSDVPKSATMTRVSQDVPPPLVRSASALQTTFVMPEPTSRVTDPTSLKQDEPPLSAVSESSGLVYQPGTRQIERLTMRQLGDATPDVMHPFFMKKAGFSLEDSLPQYVHEYATTPLEEILEALLRLYSRQLQIGNSIE